MTRHCNPDHICRQVVLCRADVIYRAPCRAQQETYSGEMPTPSSTPHSLSSRVLHYMGPARMARNATKYTSSKSHSKILPCLDWSGVGAVLCLIASSYVQCCLSSSSSLAMTQTSRWSHPHRPGSQFLKCAGDLSRRWASPDSSIWRMRSWVRPYAAPTS